MATKFRIVYTRPDGSRDVAFGELTKRQAEAQIKYLRNQKRQQNIFEIVKEQDEKVISKAKAQVRHTPRH